MIRIATEWDEQGIPTGWADYPKVHVDQVTPLLGLRFERELAELAEHGVRLGVTRWAEVVFRLRRFAAEATEVMADATRRLVDSDPETDPGVLDQVGDEVSLWMARHPWYQLAQWVAVWAAVNLGGGTISLLDVISLPMRDVQELPEPADYIDDDDAEPSEAEVVAGKE